MSSWIPEASFLLPMAAIFETGDHIADLPDGRRRRTIREDVSGQDPRGVGGKRRPGFPIRFSGLAANSRDGWMIFRIAPCEAPA